MSTDTTTRVRFFLDNAGGSWFPGRETPAQGAYRGARKLAAAEAWLNRQDNIVVTWQDDWEIDHAREFDCYADGGPETCELVSLVDPESGDTLASLGCVDDATDNYRRVIVAELALEIHRTLNRKA